MSEYDSAGNKTSITVGTSNGIINHTSLCTDVEGVDHVDASVDV